MKLFYREYGQGKPLIILHGLLGLADNWVTFARRISPHGIHCFIPDQRNHGHSPHHSVMNYYALTDDIAEFIYDHNLEQPCIMGHSMGGKVAMRYTLENPEKVNRLVVVDTSLRTYVNFEYHRNLIDSMLSINFESVRSRAEVQKILSSGIKDKRLVLFLLKNLFWKGKNKLGWRLNLNAISENLEDMYDGVFFSTRFEFPSLFVRGGGSNYILEQDLPEIYNHFTDARVETIDKSSHWVHADAPDEFFNLVKDFLTK